ncbi:glutamine amidotransferase-related protein [Buchnera aphidicola]|uniref:anthranilate synthase n=1 Tax=Buchnera aphidicola (Stegophylla sp.) TaxID=2315800 RepID=A0A4D6YND8_9GAMM|nr:anthranilate synthase component II [Buchnera aphidicola (Stegophylla sp.)]QCI26555.1 anthranilate synthase component II [Buchnera aphidicola (Stegophylla sp.)]
MKEIILLDNFDSFTYNIVDQLRVYNYHVIIYRNNVSVSTILSTLFSMKNPIVLLSPGPGIPKQSGCMMHLLSFVIGIVPVIGICLGYQAIVEYYGGVLKYTNQILHGKTSLVLHDGKEMFKGIVNPLLVARYHSCICANIPSTLTINAKYKNVIMSIRNNFDRVCGFQFHPESILTTYGDQLLYNTVKWAYSKY